MPDAERQHENESDNTYCGSILVGSNPEAFKIIFEVQA